MKPVIKITDDYIEIIGHYDDEILCAKMTMLADLCAVEKREGYAKFKNSDDIKNKITGISSSLAFFRPPPPSMGPFYNYIYVDNELHTVMSSEKAGSAGDITVLFGVYHNNSLYFLTDLSYAQPTIQDILFNNYYIENISADYTGSYYSAPNPLEEDVVYQLGFLQDFETHHTSISTSSNLNVTYNSQKIIDGLEVTPPVPITYNGSTIATLNAGDTKTLQCNGKVMASNIGIGDKTLQCNGKLMASDVVVEVVGVTPTSETWVMNEIPYVWDTRQEISIAFSSNGMRYSVFSYGGGFDPILMEPSRGIQYDNTKVFSAQDGWLSQEYRTVTFETPPTGDLLTWLQENAVKE